MPGLLDPEIGKGISERSVEMRFLANENFPGDAVAQLKAAAMTSFGFVSPRRESKTKTYWHGPREKHALC